jgi:putative transposase
MPSKNSTKIYIKNGYYHIYNRGVEKRTIFLDQQDYSVFLSYLKEYLLPKDEKELNKRLSDPKTSYREKDNVLKILRLNNFDREITLLAYCLMPNHFHFFIKQKSPGAIDKFMNSLGTRYTMYFNRKYKRVGSLYQDVYKAALIDNERQFLHLSRYIHKQALALQNQPCSYFEYVGARKTAWIHPEEILAYFSKTNPTFSYENFIEEKDDGSYYILKEIAMEEI